MNTHNRFAPSHPWDRNFFLVLLLFMWFAILSGFGYDIYIVNKAGRLHYPWIVHIHAFFYVGWLVLFSAQILLIRRKQHALHYRLGMLALFMIPIMVILGVITAIRTEQLKFGTEFANTPFISVMLGDMLVFGAIATAGMYFRKNPSAHKRLMLVATLTFSDAGFGRWLSLEWSPYFGKNYWELSNFSEGDIPFIATQLLGPFILILSIGVYDLITRKKLQLHYTYAFCWWTIISLLEGWLYFDPGWRKIALWMIGQ